ncbi:MAG TPA: hypothetical protein DCX32_01220 [Candidatus Moranbacteria bacterium]|nr:MAG: hypothetical protein UW87_C0020G0014 [Candidatus Moranbacteria bacterium GW2011_GWC2_45_10]KKT94811.1 MAG: hypothetical protein UW95_C0008G0020 [Parcubacteria group bacterium GW2011_GWC1_45_14]HAV11149.1 hypothetical protein [Candidatus Moranbacteria bacterium]
MKLKILFFPLILIASISVFIAYIWPEITDVRALAAENKKAMENLDLIRSKKDTVKSLDQELGRNRDKEELVKQYLAENKNEENIIDAVNFLATGASVSLVNISIEGGGSITDGSNEELALSRKIINQPKSSAQSETPIELKNVPFNITIAGKYENIKGFIEGLNKIALMSDVRRISVSSQKSEKEDSAPSDTLSAEIASEFYYLKSVKAQNSYNLKVLNSNTFDFSQVDRIKQFVSQGASKLEVGEKGKTNPFFSL